MASKFINKYTKRQIYTISTRLVVTNACETWTRSVQDINSLLVFARQTLRKTFSSIKCKCKRGCRIRNNNELQKLIEGEDNVKYVKARKMKWWRA